jgi:hypothetical protein
VRQGNAEKAAPGKRRARLHRQLHGLFQRLDGLLSARNGERLPEESRPVGVHGRLRLRFLQVAVERAACERNRRVELTRLELGRHRNRGQFADQPALGSEDLFCARDELAHQARRGIEVADVDQRIGVVGGELDQPRM